MGEIHNAGKAAKKVFETFLKEFKGSLRADWKEVSGGDYDEFTQKYVGAGEAPKSLSIDAIVDTDKIEFKFEKYGVDQTTDIIAFVKISQPIPPQTAIYSKLGDKRVYTLHNLYFEGNYGTDSTGNQQYCYKVLHLRAT